MRRARGQIKSKFLDRFCIPLGENLDTAVVEIADVTPNLVFCRGPLHKITKSYTLDPAADQKLSRYHLSPMRSNTP